MMEIFKENLISYIAGGPQEESVVERTSRLINKSEKSDFDFTFPGASKKDTWEKCFGKEGKKCSFDGLFKIEQEPNDPGFSNSFIWPISEIQVNNDLVFLKLDRNYVFTSIIKEIYTDGIAVPKVENKTNICLVNCELTRNSTQNTFSQLNQLRVNQICLALCRLLSSCNHSIVSKDSANSAIKLGCSDQNHLRETEQDIPLKVGQVSVKNVTNTQGYFNVIDLYFLMCNKMLEIASERESKGSQHDLLKRTKMIASSEMQMLLLSKNIDRPVNLPNLESGSNTPSDASFILYNYARITQLVYSFKCQKQKYGEILPLKNVEFSYLREPEEWNIVFDVILPYQELITEISKIKFTEKQCSTNINKYLARLCALLTKLSNTYSKYYRRVRVLREGPQGHSVIQTLNARLYLILVIKNVFDHGLGILGVHPVDYM
jgi:hypothetical protein